MMPRAPKYARVLRVIGQNLEGLPIKTFDIKSEGKNYIVKGYGGALQPVELRYSAADIARLDREGWLRRRDPSKMPDFRSLSQLLRAVGEYLERKDSQLLTISKQSGTVPSFIIQYETARHRHKEEYLGSDLYDFCVRMYKQRKN
jgi:hypothetical protein